MHNNSELSVDEAQAVKPLEKGFLERIQPIITAVNNNSINITPFIQLLPQEVKIQIFFHFSVQDWISLFNISREWRILVISLADPYLNSVNDKVEQIKSHDFGCDMVSLRKAVENFSRERGHLPSQIETLEQLQIDITCLSNPLAKLLHYQKKISEIRNAIEQSHSFYSVRQSHELSNSMFFRDSGAKFSELYKASGISFPKEVILSEKIWFKNAKFCAGLAVNNSTAKFFAEAFLEIENLNNPVNDAQDVHEVNVNSL